MRLSRNPSAMSCYRRQLIPFNVGELVLFALGVHDTQAIAALDPLAADAEPPGTAGLAARVAARVAADEGAAGVKMLAGYAALLALAAVTALVHTLLTAAAVARRRGPLVKVSAWAGGWVGGWLGGWVGAW